MKKLILALAFWFLASPAFAGVSCTLPFNLTNGTTADATQVMANYNALVTCLTNAAKSGVNSDITALTGLTTPISPAQGGTPVFAGGTAGGTANAITLAATTPSNFTLTANYTVVFIASAANTGATTLNVIGLGAVNLFKQTQAGPAALLGGEIQTNQIVIATYDGTEFQIVGENSQFASLNTTDQSLTGGANVVGFNGGSQSGGGTYTVDCGKGPLQYVTNAGNFTLAAPSYSGSNNSSSCIILVINSGTAGTISFSGFTVGANTGDALTTTNGSHFLISVVSIDLLSTYVVKATQ